MAAAAAATHIEYECLQSVNTWLICITNARLGCHWAAAGLGWGWLRFNPADEQKFARFVFSSQSAIGGAVHFFFQIHRWCCVKYWWRCPAGNRARPSNGRHGLNRKLEMGHWMVAFVLVVCRLFDGEQTVVIGVFFKWRTLHFFNDGCSMSSVYHVLLTSLNCGLIWVDKSNNSNCFICARVLRHFIGALHEYRYCCLFSSRTGLTVGSSFPEHLKLIVHCILVNLPVYSNPTVVNWKLFMYIPSFHMHYYVEV